MALGACRPDTAARRVAAPSRRGWSRKEAIVGDPASRRLVIPAEDDRELERTRRAVVASGVQVPQTRGLGARLDGPATIVELHGEHDVETAARLRAAIEGAPAGTGIVIDLTDCSFADSSIIEELLRAADRHTAFAV